MKTAIVISSCDAFSDCWQPMIYSLKKFWNDCPFPIYIINNHQTISDTNILTLNVGNDKLFASNLKFALNQLAYENIIYFQEDYFLTNYVDTAAVQLHIDYSTKNNIDFLKIHSNDFLVRDHLRIDNSIYCENPIDVRYSLNTSVAIWKKSTLEMLCVEGYSGWDWERKIIPFINKNNITIKSEILHSSVSVTEGITTISGGAVAKGRWTRSGKSFLINNGLSHLLKERPIEGIIITKLGGFYNKNPRSVLRYPIVVILRSLLKFKINI
jgi:hypothetical protein